MMGLLQRVFRKSPAQPRPVHREIFVLGDNFRDSLLKLEREARLPEGDLSLTGRSFDGVAPFAGRRITKHFVQSKTSERWKQEGRLGYIAGSVTEVKGTVEPLPGITRVGGYLIPEGQFVGRLHVAENCPGVFSKDVCTTCGYKLEGLD